MAHLPDGTQLGGDSIISQDIRLTKTFRFTERLNLDLIGEVFNVFNVSNLTFPTAISLAEEGTAARIYAAAARLNSNDPMYLLAEGTALVEQASIIDASQSKAAAEERVFGFSEAERVLKEALRLNKKLADVHLQLARVYEKRGEAARAAEELEQYLRSAANVKNAEAIRQAIKTFRATAAKS